MTIFPEYYQKYLKHWKNQPSDINIPYGEDKYTEKAIEDFKQIFGDDIDVYFVYNGTGANILSLSAFTHSYNAIICAETAHINVDECGAIEKQTGSKLLTVPTFDGKLTLGLIH